MDLLTGDDFAELFTAFEHTAFRLEVRDRYNVPEEQAGFELFLQGITADESHLMGPWCDMIRAATSDGKRIERVRVITEPHSDYIRYEMAGDPLNLAAGEDIRYLPRDHAAVAELADHDYWLFDSRMVAWMRFDEDDRLLGAELVTDPAVVIQHCYWRDAARHYAVPRERYVTR
ncbi:DUF6879 family protein [Streptosporangium subroseum]|uniref:DUF6879 family protein n=1 Tax=Streptosporangium subroseum TaxID=106412 RepID=UPI00308D031C|nr:hypothetical protein OHB15_31480 [Streptosporangium subroseum]